MTGGSSRASSSLDPPLLPAHRIPASTIVVGRDMGRSRDGHASYREDFTRVAQSAPSSRTMGTSRRSDMRALIWMVVAGCVEYDPAGGLNAGPPPIDEVPEGFALETFEGGGDSTVDVIVCSDTSGSMDVEMRTLGETITPFIDRLATYVEDWQLAAVTD